MKTIPLTQGKVALVDDEDYEFLTRHKWQAVKILNTWYAQAKVDRATVYLQQAVLDYPGRRIRHLDGDRLNCQRANLSIFGSSYQKGVYKLGNKWRASIHLGTFEDEAAAAAAYLKAQELCFPSGKLA